MSLVHNPILAAFIDKLHNAMFRGSDHQSSDPSQYLKYECSMCHTPSEDTELRIQQIAEIDRIVHKIQELGCDAQVQHICNACLRELNSQKKCSISEYDSFHPINHIFIFRKDAKSQLIYSLVEDLRDFRCVLFLLQKQSKHPIDPACQSAYNDLKQYSTRKRIKAYCGQTISWRDFLNQMATNSSC